MDPSFPDYQRAILDAWYALSCTRGRPPRSDRALLLELYRRRITLPVVLVAFRLAAARRSADLAPVRSIAYFRSVIEELLLADPGYIAYLDSRL
jgi:hypothetical protein